MEREGFDLVPSVKDEKNIFIKKLKKGKYNFIFLQKTLCDFIIIINKQLVFIEMKRTVKSTVGVEQQNWIDALNKCEGVTARVCYGADEAINFVKNFKELKTKTIKNK